MGVDDPASLDERSNGNLLSQSARLNQLFD